MFYDFFAPIFFKACETDENNLAVFCASVHVVSWTEPNYINRSKRGLV